MMMMMMMITDWMSRKENKKYGRRESQFQRGCYGNM